MIPSGAGRADGPAGSAAFGALLSGANTRVVEARKLTKAAGRRTAGQFLAEGAPAVREALAARAVVALYVTADAAARHPELVESARTLGAAVNLIDARTAAGLSQAVTPQGLIAVCPRQPVDLVEALLPGPTLVAALVEGNDPGNAGTVLRTADAAGAGAMVFAGVGVDPYNAKAVRATAGSLFHLPVVLEPSPAHLVATARSAGLQVLATTGRGAVDLDDLIDAGSLGRPTLWLFGNEAHGLPEEVLDSADVGVRIPIYGAAESLNLATAAAVCLYASARALRQPI
jgi:TrmH family RNA methyltransferase